jgi:hypothetical protein
VHARVCWCVPIFWGTRLTDGLVLYKKNNVPVIVCQTCSYFLDFLSPCYLISSPCVTFRDHTYLFRINTCRSFSKLPHDSATFHTLPYCSITFCRTLEAASNGKTVQEHATVFRKLLDMPLRLMYINCIVRTAETLSLSFVYTIQVIVIY